MAYSATVLLTCCVLITASLAAKTKKKVEEKTPRPSQKLFPVTVEGTSGSETVDLGSGIIQIDKDTEDTVSITIMPTSVPFPYQKLVVTVEGDDESPEKEGFGSCACAPECCPKAPIVGVLTPSAKTFSGFRIVSKYSSRALQIVNGDEIRLHDIDANNANQLWYVDQNKIVRSMVNNYCLRSDGPTPVKIRVTPCTTPSRESWTMSNSRLRNLLDPIRCIMISEVNFNAAHLSGAFVVDGECYDRIETHRLWEAVF